MNSTVKKNNQYEKINTFKIGKKSTIKNYVFIIFQVEKV